jgi:hypothetical protein
MKNTKRQGQFRFLIYKKSGNKYYTGVCLDLDIVEENEDPIKLRKNLEEAAQGYLEAVCKKGLNEELLEQKAPKEYWALLEDLEKYLRLMRQPIKSSHSLDIQDSQIFTKNIADFACV